ncbi:MAG: hypothetical protein NTZ90_11195 [Proteobacteria bacterium]|jgi:hypothetical protein|nr:hypothetical protein [Pseudomonadota bacterium]
MQRQRATIMMAVLALSSLNLAAGKRRPPPVNDRGGGFLLTNLPKGKDVTMPQPATTYVPLAARIMLTATDMPQTLSFRPVNIGHGPVHGLRLVIFDENSERVQYRDMQPGTPFLYPVKTLTTVTVMAEAIGTPSSGVFLQVESDKPLTIAH